MTTREVCDLCGLPIPTLSLWIRAGVIKPATMGGKGRGNSHRFSYQQVFGLALIAALHDGLGRQLGPLYVRMLMENADRIPDRDMEAWLRREKSPWDAQRVASWKAMGSLMPPTKELPPGWKQRIDRVLDEFSRRLDSKTGEERDALGETAGRNRGPAASKKPAA